MFRAYAARWLLAEVDVAVRGAMVEEPVGDTCGIIIVIVVTVLLLLVTSIVSLLIVGSALVSILILP